MMEREKEKYEMGVSEGEKKMEGATGDKWQDMKPGVGQERGNEGQK